MSIERLLEESAAMLKRKPIGNKRNNLVLVGDGRYTNKKPRPKHTGSRANQYLEISIRKLNESMQHIDSVDFDLALQSFAESKKNFESFAHEHQ